MESSHCTHSTSLHCTGVSLSSPFHSHTLLYISSLFLHLHLLFILHITTTVLFSLPHSSIFTRRNGHGYLLRQRRSPPSLPTFSVSLPPLLLCKTPQVPRNQTEPSRNPRNRNQTEKRNRLTLFFSVAVALRRCSSSRR